MKWVVVWEGIKMFLFFESVVYNNTLFNEQEDQEQQDQEEQQQQEDQEQQNPLEQINAELEPIKKYYMISKLIKLQNNLSSLNYENDILNNLIQFIDNISYNHLIIIVPELLKIVDKDLKSLNKKQSKDNLDEKT